MQARCLLSRGTHVNAVLDAPCSFSASDRALFRTAAKFFGDALPGLLVSRDARAIAFFVSSLGGGPVVTDSRGRPRITTSMFPSTTRASAMMYWPPRSNPSVPSIGVELQKRGPHEPPPPIDLVVGAFALQPRKKFARTQSPVRGRGSIRSGNVVAFLLPLHSWNGAALSHRIGAAGAAFAAT